jgi:hypothetical protein
LADDRDGEQRTLLESDEIPIAVKALVMRGIVDDERLPIA